MVNNDICIEVSADPKLLGAVRAMMRAYVSSFGFSDDRCNEIVLAVDEACTNAIRHAYQGKPGRMYRLALKSTPTWLEFELRDGGRPAPLEKVQPASIKAPTSPDLITPGGLGVQLIFETCDKVTFSPGKTRGNRVSMKVKRPKAR